MPEVSIIVPVYQVEAYLERCVASILNQTFCDFELILVDDGSKDQCPHLCDLWKERDGRIRVIHKQNGGLSDARNAGLDIAAGKYICFVDSDDWLTPDSLQYLYDLLLRYDADFSMAEHIRTSGMAGVGQAQIHESLLSREQFLERFFKIGRQVDVQYAWAKLYRAELFDHIRFPFGLTAEDIPVAFEIAQKSGRIAYSDKCVYYYFSNPDSLTRTAFDRRKFDLLQVWDIVCERAVQLQCDPWIIEQAKINRYRADFGVLCNWAMAELSQSEKESYRLEMKQLQQDLRKNRKKLLHARIPFSRKLLITAFCLSCQKTAWMMGFFQKLRRSFLNENEAGK